MKKMINGIINKIKQFGIIETVVFAIYIIMVLIITINHECYEDETQSWLIARDLNFIEIIQQMKYEGHSFLWFYILAPFAKLGFSIEIEKCISMLFSIATVFIILKKAPFNKFLKILLTFSSGMIYFYSAIARPYCMIPFLLVCIAVVYKNKKEHPYLYATLIGLLANTHLVMLPTATLLMISFWGEELILRRKEQSKEKKKQLIISLLIVLIFMLMYGLIVLFTLENCAVVNNFDRTSSVKSISMLFNMIIETARNEVKYIYGAYNVPVWYNVISIIVLVLCIIGTKNNWKQAIIFWSQFIFTLLIHTLSWFILITRVLIVIYTLMFWLWTYKEDKQYKKKLKRNIWIEIALVILIIMSAPATYKVVYQDLFGNFSTGKMTAEYIKGNIPEGSCFICANQELHQSVVAYLNKDEYKFYLPNINDFVTYITWDEDWNTPISDEDVSKSIDKLKQEYKNLYVLNIMPTKIYGNYVVEEIFESEGKLLNSYYNRTEIFYIFKINN